MEACTICRVAEAPRDPAGGSPPACPACGMLLQWFLDFYADVEFREEGWITPETTFLELSVESLDYVGWVIEAEGQFGVTISDHDAERIQTVGDFLRFIRHQSKVEDIKLTLGVRHPLWDPEIDR